MDNVTVVAAPLVVSFPNGKDVASPQVLSYVTQYQGFLRKTAEAILGLATTLNNAESDLDELGFALFLDEIGLSRNSSTFSKLKKIGEMANRFTPFLDKLPNTWTTIYKLSKLEGPVFDRISSELNPFITVKEIDALVGGEQTSNSPPVDFSFAANNLASDQKLNLYNEIRNLQKTYGFELKTNQTFVDEIKVVKLSQAA